MQSAPSKEMVGQSLVVVILGIFTVMLLTKPFPWLPLLDNANLLIHESGHTFFSSFGELVSTWGGSVMQISIPFFFMLYFLYQRQFFSTGFAIFWFGDNLINISVYIKDARTMLLPMINEGGHDWNFILGKTNWLPYDQLIGNGVYLLGVVSVLAGLVLCFYVWYSNCKKLFSQKL